MKTLFFLAVIHILCAGNTELRQLPPEFNSVNDNIEKAIADTTSLKGQWYLQPILPSDTATGKTPTLNFDLAKNTFTGNTGCNTMRGSFQKTDSSFVFNENIATTKMLCTGYNEEAFIKNLLRTNKYKIEDGMLILMFDATELSRWTRKKTKGKVLST